MSQELDLGPNEVALGELDLQSRILHDGEDLKKVVKVFLQRHREDNDVVKVHTNEGEVTQKLIHEPLERRGGIHETEREDLELVGPELARECCLFFDVIGEGYLPIRRGLSANNP